MNKIDTISCVYFPRHVKDLVAKLGAKETKLKLTPWCSCLFELRETELQLSLVFRNDRPSEDYIIPDRPFAFRITMSEKVSDRSVTGALFLNASLYLIVPSGELQLIATVTYVTTVEYGTYREIRLGSDETNDQPIFYSKIDFEDAAEFAIRFVRAA